MAKPILKLQTIRSRAAEGKLGSLMRDGVRKLHAHPARACCPPSLASCRRVSVTPGQGCRRHTDYDEARLDGQVLCESLAAGCSVAVTSRTSSGGPAVSP